LYGLLVAQWMLESLRVGAVLGVTPGVIAGANTLSAWLQIAFAATAIYWTIGYWRADLIAARRRTRAVVAIILCVNVVASTILLRLVIPENSIGNYYGHVVLSMATLALLLFLLLRSMNGDVGIFTYDQPAAAPTMPLQVLEERRQAKARPGTDAIRKSEDELALKRLDGLLRDQHIHWESGLSLKQLAERVRLPEYRMRQLIHEHLGHRNFNSFLHVYRIHDAVEQLTDPGRRGTPILAIAQSVGYESVNTFNRGFKEVMNVTPSEYRERALP
jgi:AraC-like DNA-binding protein